MSSRHALFLSQMAFMIFNGLPPESLIREAGCSPEMVVIAYTQLGLPCPDLEILLKTAVQVRKGKRKRPLTGDEVEWDRPKPDRISVDSVKLTELAAADPVSVSAESGSRVALQPSASAEKNSEQQKALRERLIQSLLANKKKKIKFKNEESSREGSPPLVVEAGQKNVPLPVVPEKPALKENGAKIAKSQALQTATNPFSALGSMTIAFDLSDDEDEGHAQAILPLQNDILVAKEREIAKMQEMIRELEEKKKSLTDQVREEVRSIEDRCETVSKEPSVTDSCSSRSADIAQDEVSRSHRDLQTPSVELFTGPRSVSPDLSAETALVAQDPQAEPQVVLAPASSQETATRRFESFRSPLHVFRSVKIATLMDDWVGTQEQVGRENGLDLVSIRISKEIPLLTKQYSVRTTYTAQKEETPSAMDLLRELVETDEGRSEAERESYRSAVIRPTLKMLEERNAPNARESHAPRKRLPPLTPLTCQEVIAHWLDFKSRRQSWFESTLAHEELQRRGRQVYGLLT